MKSFSNHYGNLAQRQGGFRSPVRRLADECLGAGVLVGGGFRPSPVTSGVKGRPRGRICSHGPGAPMGAAARWTLGPLLLSLSSL